MTDPITDMFNQIRNAQLVDKPNVSLPCSKVKLAICEVLKEGGFIKDFKSKGRKFKTILIDLKYQSDKSPVVSGFKRISKPGRRLYQKAAEIKRVKSGHGLSIVSTPKGIMNGKEARKKKLGGEIMIEVW